MLDVDYDTSTWSVHEIESACNTLLEEFRLSGGGKSGDWTISTVTGGSVVAFCQDQHGSRFLQQQLEGKGASAGEKEALFQEVLPRALELMTDVFGNYVMQKLFEHGRQDHCEALLRLMEGHAVNLAMNM